MNDKISGPGSSRFPTYTGGTGATNRGAARAPANSGANTPGQARAQSSTDDAVSLTGDAELLQALDAQIAATPSVNAARVAEVRTALSNGEYRVNPERIASKLLEVEGGAAALLFRN
ncbi:MAG: flagellar biosynthesis anti-sigma factor FlgM [Pseudomonadota bacterium]